MVLLPGKDLVSFDEQEGLVHIGDQRINLRDWLRFLDRNPSALDYLNCIPRILRLVSGTSRLDEFHDITYIGSGAYSSVYSATHRLDGRKYALKIMRNLKSSDDLKHAKDEVEMLSRLDHPNIVRYITCWIEMDAISDSVATSTVPPSVNISPASSNVSWASTNPSRGGSPQRFVNGSSSSGTPSLGEENGVEEGIVTDRRLTLPSGRRSNWVPSRPQVTFGSSLIIQMDLCQSTLEHWLSQRNAFLFSTPTPPALLTNSSFSSMDPPIDELDRVMGKAPWSHLHRAPVRWLFDQIAEGVAYLHTSGLLHRDLKPANVFLQGPPLQYITEAPCSCSISRRTQLADESIYDSDLLLPSDPVSSSFCYHHLHVKIGDFGLSTRLANGNKTSTASIVRALPAPQPNLPPKKSYSRMILLPLPSSRTACLTGDLGTTFYMAPEVFSSSRQRRSIYGFKADMYSLGVILFQFLYPCHTESELVFLLSQFQQAEQTTKTRAGDDYAGFSGDLLPRELQLIWPIESNLLARLLSLCPGDRPAADELLRHLSATSEILDHRHQPVDLGHQKLQNGSSEAVKQLHPQSLYDLLDRLVVRNRQLEDELARLRQRPAVTVKTKAKGTQSRRKTREKATNS